MKIEKLLDSQLILILPRLGYIFWFITAFLHKLLNVQYYIVLIKKENAIGRSILKGKSKIGEIASCLLPIDSSTLSQNTIIPKPKSKKKQVKKKEKLISKA